METGDGGGLQKTNNYGLPLQCNQTWLTSMEPLFQLYYNVLPTYEWVIPEMEDIWASSFLKNKFLLFVFSTRCLSMTGYINYQRHDKLTLQISGIFTQFF